MQVINTYFDVSNVSIVHSLLLPTYPDQCIGIKSHTKIYQLAEQSFH